LRVSRPGRDGGSALTAILNRDADLTEVIDTVTPDVRGRWRALPWVVLVLSLALFVYGERTIPGATPSQYGLLSVASPAYGVSILLAALGFLVALRQGNFAAAGAATLMMIIAQRLPRTIATDLPMYAWTYKHLGVTDYIQHAHTLARDVDIYNGWPSLFALTAWFSDLTGISEVTIAHWWTPIFHVFLASAVYGAARAWRLPPLTAITATFLVATLNWVEQDYFSAQATVIYLAVGIFALVGLSRDRPVGTLLLIILFGAATITHQLTPFWIFGAIGLLVITRRMKPWWIVFPLGAILLAFLLYNWDQTSQYELFSSNPIKNAESNIPIPGSAGQQMTSAGVRVLSATIWVGTALTLVYRMFKRQEFWALGVLALSPMLVLGGQSYGGEAIFRVFLYSLLGCSIVLAPVLVAAVSGKPVNYLAGGLTVLVATALSAQGYTGSWYANVMPKEQYETSQVVLAQAELPAYLTSVAPVWPERSSWRYVDFARFQSKFDSPMTYAKDLMMRHYDNDEDYAVFVKALESRPDASTYLIFTEQMRVYAWYFGILPWDAFPNLKAKIFADKERWEPVFDGQGITVFVHRVDPNAYR
jgi:hypothetical protein